MNKKNIKIILFSDIHWNIESLKEFIKISKNIEYDYSIFLGDIFWYYYHSFECFKLLKNNIKNLILLKWNHDKYFENLNKSNDKLKELINKYGSSYERDFKNIDYWIFNELIKFPEYIYLEKDWIFACHGWTEDFLEWRIYPDTELLKSDSFMKSKFPKWKIALFWNTHYWMIREHEWIIYANPGSVGQPRDNQLPSFLIIDIFNWNISCKIKRYNYNKLRLIKEINNNDPNNNYLEKVLLR